MLLDEPFIFIVQPNPNPDKVIPILQGKSPVVRADTDRPEFTDLFKVEGGVTRIFF